MCGLVGMVSSAFQQKHKECLSTLLFLDTFRGRDSTGVAAVRQNGDTSTLKSTVPGYEFVEGPKLFEHLKITDTVWIGHNRFGTVGKNCKTNSHPFEILDAEGACNLVGAHNGTLKNKYVLQDHATFGTDSEAFFNEIDKTSVEEAVAKVEGAWAITYFDHVEEEFRVLRNKERPLFYAFSDDKKTLIWASELWMLRIATSRCDIKLLEDKIFSFEEDTLYRFSSPQKFGEEVVLIDRKEGVVGKQPAPFFQTSRIGGAPPQQSGTTPPQSTVPRYTGNYARSGEVTRTPHGNPCPAPLSSQSGTKTDSSGEKQPPKSGTGSTNDTGNNVVLLPGRTYRGYASTPLTLNELKDELANGCAWCEMEMIDIRDRFAWLAPKKPICGKCLSGTEEVDVSLLSTPAVSVH